MENAGVPTFQNYYWIVILALICIMLFSGAIIWYYVRKCRRQQWHDYTALEDEALLSDRLEMDRKLLRDSDRNMAMIKCQYYLRDSGRYLYINQLPDIGSRRSKHWFLVKDTKTKTERLLTMTLLTENCPVRHQYATSPVLLELLQNLHHPYIYPILDIDCRIITEQEFAITVIPFNENGTLKDLIYQTRHGDYKKKSHFKGYPLQPSQIQRLGCQILEALIFLKNQRFPPFVHLHSGNIILQNGVARISGLENALLGYTSRQHLLIPKKVYLNKEAAEIICFGHLLFEMAAGYELQTSQPMEKNYTDLEYFPQVAQVLLYIFNYGHHQYPALKEVASLEFFRHIDLRELQSHVPIPVVRKNLSQDAKYLLKEINKYQRRKKRSKRSQSMSTLDTTSIDSRESASISSSKRVKKKKRNTLPSSETTPDKLGTPLQTLPLSDIEASCSIPSSQQLTSFDINDPQSSNRQFNKQGPIPTSLLIEIRSGSYNLKHVGHRNPKV